MLRSCSSIDTGPINLNTVDPVQAIMAKDANGDTRSVDCVGFEAINSKG